MRIAFSALLIATMVAACSQPSDKSGPSNNDSTATNNDTSSTNNSTATTNNSTTATNSSTTTTNNSTSTNGSTAGTNNIVRPEDCADDEVFVSDYCQRCGQANGCDSSGPECRPACETEGEPCESGGSCFNGACRRLCG